MRDEVLRELVLLADKWETQTEHLQKNNNSCWPSGVASECLADIKRLIVTVVRMKDK